MLVFVGWAFVCAAAGMLALTDGAWGLAMGTTTGMIVALALLAHAAFTSPEGFTAEPRVRLEQPRTAVTLPDFGRRATVFVLVVLANLSASLWLGVMLHRIAITLEWKPADALALALFAVPVLGALAACFQLLQRSLLRMTFAPLAMIATGAVLWLMT